METAGWGDFLWRDPRFLPSKLSLNASLLPALLIVAFINSLRVLGDVTGTLEATHRGGSQYGSGHGLRGCCEDGSADRLTDRSFFLTIKGGLFSFGVSSVLSGVCGYLPLATLSQNSCLVTLSRTSCPRVGYMACFWLVVLGVVPKLGAAVASIPNCVWGGVVSVLFAGQMFSGIKLMLQGEDDAADHRSRIILAVGLASGLGVALVPSWATMQLGNGLAHSIMSTTSSQACKLAVGTVTEALVLLLSTPYSLGSAVALVAHALMPLEKEGSTEMEASTSLHQDTPILLKGGNGASLDSPVAGVSASQTCKTPLSETPLASQPLLAASETPLATPPLQLVHTRNAACNTEVHTPTY